MSTMVGVHAQRQQQGTHVSDVFVKHEVRHKCRHHVLQCCSGHFIGRGHVTCGHRLRISRRVLLHILHNLRNGSVAINPERLRVEERREARTGVHQQELLLAAHTCVDVQRQRRRWRWRHHHRAGLRDAA